MSRNAVVQGMRRAAIVLTVGAAILIGAVLVSTFALTMRYWSVNQLSYVLPAEMPVVVERRSGGPLLYQF